MCLKLQFSYHLTRIQADRIVFISELTSRRSASSKGCEMMFPLQRFYRNALFSAHEVPCKLLTLSVVAGMAYERHSSTHDVFCHQSVPCINCTIANLIILKKLKRNQFYKINFYFQLHLNFSILEYNQTWFYKIDYHFQIAFNFFNSRT